jgi:hypothetical protein
MQLPLKAAVVGSGVPKKRGVSRCWYRKIDRRQERATGFPIPLGGGASERSGRSMKRGWRFAAAGHRDAGIVTSISIKSDETDHV